MLIPTNKFFEIAWGFTQLWTIQNDYILWSMKRNDEHQIIN